MARVADSTTADMPIAQVLERIAFALICDRRKATVGEGNRSVGDLLPGLLSQAGLVDIQSVLNHKTFALVSPYEVADRQALRDAIITKADSDWWIWSRDDAHRYFLAGGGQEAEFEHRWQHRLDETRHTAQELAGGRLHTAGGAIHYLISGQRPAG